MVELADRRNQWAGKLLADGGARVIQIEPIDGSPGRWCGPFVDDKVDPDRCLDYWWYNTGKQSVALDIERKPAQDLVRQLLARADIFLESTPPGTLARVRAGLRLRRGQPGADLRLAHRLRPGRPVARLPDERRRPSRARRPDGEHGLLGSQRHADRRTGPSGVAHGLRLRAARHHRRPVRPHDDAARDSTSTSRSTTACAIGTEGAVPQWLYYGETIYRQTGMHAAARRQPDLELPTADGMYMIAVNPNFSDHVVGKAGQVDGGEGRRGRADGREVPGRGVPDRGVSAGHRHPRRHSPADRRQQGRGGIPSRAVVRHHVGGHPRTRGELRRAPLSRSGTSGARSSIRRSAAPIPYPRGPYVSDELRIEPRGRAPHLGEHTTQVLERDLGLRDAQIAALAAAGVLR